MRERHAYDKKVGQFYLLKTSVWRELYGKFLESITYDVL